MGIVAHWLCKDNVATTAVAALTNSAGTLVGGNSNAVSAASSVGTFLDRWFLLNGTSQYFTIPNLSGVLGTNWAITWWGQLQNTTPTLPGKTGVANLGPAGSGGASHFPYSDGNIYLSLGRYTNSTTPNRISFSDATSRNVPCHWCITNQSGANGYKVYLDGVQIYQTTGTTTPYWTGSIWMIGRSQDNIPNIYYWDGYIGDVRIYDETLDSTKLAAIRLEKDLPTCSVAPAITGTLEVGQNLTCTNGTWSQGTLTHQWYSNTSNSTSGATLLVGQTGSTYAITAADVATKWFFRRTTAATTISSATADSNIVGPVPLKVLEANVAPFNVFNSLVTTSTNLATATLTKPEYDWSGISWKGLIGGVTPDAGCPIACLLISNTHAIAAWHCGPAVGDTIDFRNPAGTVYTYTVSVVTRLGGTSDLRLVKFSSTPHSTLKRFRFLTRQHWLNAYPRYLWSVEWSGEVEPALPNGFIDRNSNLLNLGTTVSSSGKPTLAVTNSNELLLVGQHHYTTIDERYSDYHLALIVAALVSEGEFISLLPAPNEIDRPIVDGPLPKLFRARWR